MMNAAPPDMRRNVLAGSAVVELGTGVALLLAPMRVETVLLGVSVEGVGTLLARCFGIALIALGIACRPPQPPAPPTPGAFRAMLLYNGSIALYLTYVGTLGHLAGWLLWPAALLHAGVTVLLLRPEPAAARLASHVSQPNE